MDEVVKWVAGVDDGVVRRGGCPVPGTRWFLIPELWYQEVVAAPSAPHPRIDNAGLMEDTGGCPDPDSRYRQIKKGLREKDDYRVVPEKAWDYLVRHYGAAEHTEIQRESHTIEGHRTSFDTYLRSVSVMFVCSQTTESALEIFVSELKVAHISQFDSLFSLKTRLKAAFSRYFPDNQPKRLSIRIWTPSIQSPYALLESSLRASFSSPTRLFPGELLTDDQRLSNISAEVVVAEVNNDEQDWLFQAFHELKCQLCGSQIGKQGLACGCGEAYFCDEACRAAKHSCPVVGVQPLSECQCCHSRLTGVGFTCPCKSYEYCDQECYRKDLHDCEETDRRRTCEVCRRELPIQAWKCGCGIGEYCTETCANTHGCVRDASLCPQCRTPLSPTSYVCHCGLVISTQYHFCSTLCSALHAHTCPVDSSPTECAVPRVGLRNLGNTCYLNSALQCLVHTQFLREFLTSGEWEKEVNTKNELGSGGKLVGAVGKLVRKMEKGGGNYVVPTEVKREVAAFAEQFRGNDQHDSQELLSFLLDGLHEDLNRISTKPFASELKPSLDERLTADSVWRQHLEWNSSLIVDNMHGMYRSQITCPKCGKNSVQFDPFLMLSVDIPPSPINIEVYLIPPDFTQRATSFFFALPSESHLSSLLPHLHPLLPPPSSPVQVFELDTSTHSLNPLSPTSPLSDTECGKAYFVYQTAEVDPDEEISVLVHIFREDRSCGYTRSTMCTYPRILRFPSETRLDEVHYRVFQAVRPVVKLRDETPQSDTMEVDSSTDVPSAQGVYKRLYDEKNANLRISRSADALYSLKTVNYNRHWNYCRPGSDVCPYCHSVHYNHCSLPFEDRTLREYVKDQEEGQMLQVQVLCPQGMFDSGFSGEADEHPSVPIWRLKASADRESPTSLHSCLEYTCRPKLLSDDNLWFCSDCQKPVAGSKRMSLYRLPPCLVIHLKRFKQSEQCVGKNEKEVAFPISRLDLTKFCEDTGGSQPCYSLYAVNQHRGSLAFGHYTAVCRDEEGWASYDDHRVERVLDEGEIANQDAYVLFYQAESE